MSGRDNIVRVVVSLPDSIAEPNGYKDIKTRIWCLYMVFAYSVGGGVRSSRLELVAVPTLR